MLELANTRALVTGASQGIGAGIARALAAAGAQVILVARNDAALRELKHSIETSGGRAEVLQADLSSRAACRALATASGDVDILVNNAALTTLSLKGVAVVEDDYWDAAIMLNLLVPKTLIECFGPGMMQRRSGCIINISSIGAHFAPPHTAPYSVTKAALEQMTKVAAMEMAPFGVRVNAIAPGVFATDAIAALLKQSPESRQEMIGSIPAGRTGEVEEIGQLCVFLASDKAAYINGAVLTIDGAKTAGTFYPSG